jgi:hypothetical protein
VFTFERCFFVCEGRLGGNASAAADIEKICKAGAFTVPSASSGGSLCEQRTADLTASNRCSEPSQQRCGACVVNYWD